MFADKVEIEVRAGKGGDGRTSFRHEKFRAKGGADGGDGGRGGSVIFEADHNLNTLSYFRSHKAIKAATGQPGDRNRQHGKSGGDVVVKVPIGTVVAEDDRQLADLSQAGAQVVIARGGRGGFGNAHFMSSVRQAPRTAELGEPGERKKLVVELKLVADVGLVGLPNAGKSTLLAAVSNARPEIGDYPFTTVVPNLGMAEFDDRALVVADVPGLIAGASQGKGLGDEFLRHLERTRVLIHLIDINQPDIAQAYATIQQELRDYQIDLSVKPQLVALTKVETLPVEEVARRQEQLEDLTAAKVWTVSAAARQGLTELLRATATVIDQQPDEPEELPVIGLADQPTDWSVAADGDARWVVAGTKIERFAVQTDFNNPAAVERLRDIMNKMGIIKALEQQGLRPGDAIQVGSRQLEW